MLTTMKNKKIGVWGYGVFGKAMVQFLQEQNHQIAIMDKKTVPEQLGEAEIQRYTEGEKGLFFTWADLIIPSAGIKIEDDYQTIKDKMITEFDFFYTEVQKRCTAKIIAITGTVGKTSITKLLSDFLLLAGKKIVYGGNIGIPTVQLLKDIETQNPEYIILEASSFQLNYITSFKPDIAVITNISPNHLDWHGSMAAYTHAKLNIMHTQKETDHAYLPYTIARQLHSEGKLPKSSLHILGDIPENQEVLEPASWWYIENGWIHCKKKDTLTKIVACNDLPEITFIQNWVTVVQILSQLNVDIVPLIKKAHTLTVPPHRMEKVKTRLPLTVYNDSKASTIEATNAAIKRLQDNPIRLILGGHGKGVDRTPLIMALPPSVKKIYCFGVEAEILYTMCVQHNKNAELCDSLESLVETCLHESDPGDQILFSPAGTSWDLFKNYEERGNLFKKLVMHCDATTKILQSPITIDHAK